MKREPIRRKPSDPDVRAQPDPDARDGGVQSVDRALQIMEALAEDDEGYRLTDLAIRIGLPPSTVATQRREDPLTMRRTTAGTPE